MCSLLLSSVLDDDLPSLSPTLLLRSLREIFSRYFVTVSMFGAFIFFSPSKAQKIEKSNNKKILMREYFFFEEGKIVRGNFGIFKESVVKFTRAYVKGEIRPVTVRTQR